MSSPSRTRAALSGSSKDVCITYTDRDSTTHSDKLFQCFAVFTLTFSLPHLKLSLLKFQPIVSDSIHLGTNLFLSSPQHVFEGDSYVSHPSLLETGPPNFASHSS